MKAHLIISLAGDPMREIGEIVEGPEAIRFIEAGFAVPEIEERVVEKATRTSARKETRAGV